MWLIAVGGMALATTTTLAGCSEAADETPRTGQRSTGSTQTVASGSLRGPEQRRPPTQPESTRLSAPTSVPLTPLKHLMTVEAMLNGRGPYRLVIDTGSAALLRVSPELVSQLSLPQIGEVQVSDPGGGAPVTVPVVRVGSTAIGQAVFEGIEATVGANLGDIRPDGIIGLALFARLTATIDYPGRSLRLFHRALPRRGRHVVRFTLNLGVPQITVSAANVMLRADIDTGGPAALTVPSTARLPLREKPRIVGKGRTARSEFIIRAAPLSGDLAVAGWITPRPMVNIVDAFPVASLGSGYLRRFVVTFDSPNKRLALRR
jgi:predicted aspartyl protease